MVHEFYADLHIHTCLSPCGELEMSPSGIVEAALARGINIIAICDHNSALNVPYVIRAAKSRGLEVVPGMEVNTKEEVHLLALFETQEAAFAMQEEVYAVLPGENDEETFGLQVIANENSEVEGFEKRLLIGACGLSLERAIEIVHGLGGLAIPSHIDREAFSLVGQLGFIPPGLPVDALEISRRTKPEEAIARIPEAKGYPLITNSDAHFLEDVGKAFTRFRLKTRSFDEIRMALKREDGRGSEI